MGPHRGPPKGWSPPGDKKIGDPKRSILECIFDIKKRFLEKDIRPRDSIWDPIGDHLRMIPPGDKKNWGSKKVDPRGCF